MFTDLFVHQTTHLIAAMGVRYPGRVVGAGGIYLEYDGRDVPDVATVVADYDEGCQVIISATMCNDHRIDECIRGHLGDARLRLEAPSIAAEPEQGPWRFGYTILAAKMCGRRRRSRRGDPPRKEPGAGRPARGMTPTPCGRTSCNASRRRIATRSARRHLGPLLHDREHGASATATARPFSGTSRARKPVEADPSWATAWSSARRNAASRTTSWAGRAATRAAR